MKLLIKLIPCVKTLQYNKASDKSKAEENMTYVVLVVYTYL